MADRNEAPSTIPTQHRKSLELIRELALDLAGNMNIIANAVGQVLENGGTADVQPQIDFLTSAYARMLKDWGVICHLQRLGAQQRRRSFQSR